ncbi:MAG TPA: lysophospholipid acyltransferase family protein [Planctomycetaceae bacterium]|nr:lysophospholipid acyltransferase family protein [Planctomycetaceae bacterium]
MSITLRHRLEYFGFRLAVCAVECLPVRVAARFADALAWCVQFLLPRKLTRFPVTQENLRRAFGADLSHREASELAYGMWRHLFRTVVEVVQSPRKLHLWNYRRLTDFIGLQETNEALLSGRRLLLLAGHFGNWEIALSLFGMWGFPLGVVAREMDNPLLDRWFRRYREDRGHRQMSKKGGYDDMLVLLKKGGNLALLCDQDAGPRGLFVDFFGHSASTFKSIALLALEYDAIVVVGCSARCTDDFTHSTWSQFQVRCEAVIDPRALTSDNPVREITQGFTSAIENAIRRRPEQYFWVHRRWKSEPKVRQKPAAEQPRLAG